MRDCSVEREFTSMSTNNKLPVGSLLCLLTESLHTLQILSCENEGSANVAMTEF